MNKIKVLHTDNSMSYTGGFKALFDYIISEKSRIDSIVILPKGSTCVRNLEKEGITCYEIPFVEIRKNGWSLLCYFPLLFINSWRIKKIANKEKVKVLHSNDLYNLSLYLVKYLFKYNAPLVTHLRLMPTSFPVILYSIWKAIHLKYSNALIAVSKAVKYAYGNSNNIHLVYDIMETKEHYPEYFLKDNFEKMAPFNFLYLANYTRGKGQDLALQAFARFVLVKPNSTLTFVGGDLGMYKNRKFKQELIKIAHEKSVSSNIIFEGFIDDVEFKMKQYDCVLNFSESESFSYTSYEALRFGIPLIVTDCGGPAELFQDGKSGILIRQRSIEEILIAMKRISSDKEISTLFSINSRLYIKSLMDTSHKFSYLSDLFLRLANE